MKPTVPEARDKLLFTPGPLTTSRSVKQALLRDLGSRDGEFITKVAGVRRKLLAAAAVSQAGGYEAVLMQGSGTFGVESVIGSVVPAGGRLLVATNGAYGERMGQIAARLAIRHEVLRFPEDSPVDPQLLRTRLEGVTHVAAVHCETTSGMLNPIAEVGRGLRQSGRVFIVDAMSSFGALPLDLEAGGVDFLVASANKCLEGIPGLSFVIARRSALLACEGRARSLSLDLFAQWTSLETNGQFRFTPPTHVLLALDQALDELEAEGGPRGRLSRYSRNHAVLVAGMRELGFEPYLRDDFQAPIITAFRYPNDPAFRFEEFYDGLHREGMVIYPGKLGNADCFRIGNIGRLFEADIRALLSAVGRVWRATGGGPTPPPRERLS